MADMARKWSTVPLRLGIGAAFTLSGFNKVAVVGLGSMGGRFAEYGAPMPDLTGPLVAVVELACGVLLTIGLFTRFSALMLGGVMAGALFFYHLPQDEVLRHGVGVTASFGWPAALLLGLIVLMVQGSEVLATDAAIGMRKTKKGQ